MKIAIIDQLFPFGHKKLNSSLIKIIKSDFEIILLEYQNCYNDISSDESLEKIKLKWMLFPKRIRILQVLCNLINLFVMIFMLRKKEYDEILLLTYENISFSLFMAVFKKCPVYIMHHNNIDFLKSRADFFSFKSYMNKVTHIVLADFIKKGLIAKTKVDHNRVYVLNTPLRECFKKNNEKSQNGIFISLGLGNNENIISQLIELDKKVCFFKKNKIKLVLRSNRNEYESEGMKVFSGLLSEQEYYDLFASATAYLSLYPKSFQNSFSLSIFNALQLKKRVICTDIPVARHFKELYPQNCIIFKNMEELLAELSNYDHKFNMEEYGRLLKKHDESSIRQQLINIFCKRTNVNGSL